MPTRTRPAKKKSVRVVPAILPREPLTKKAIAAICEYSIIRGRDLRIHHLMVRYVLEAERMRRADLYAYLEQRGFKWTPEFGLWIKKEVKK